MHSSHIVCLCVCRSSSDASPILRCDSLGCLPCQPLPAAGRCSQQLSQSAGSRPGPAEPAAGQSAAIGQKSWHADRHWLKMFLSGRSLCSTLNVHSVWLLPYLQLVSVLQEQPSRNKCNNKVSSSYLLLVSNCHISYPLTLAFMACHRGIFWSAGWKLQAPPADDPIRFLEHLIDLHL